MAHIAYARQPEPLRPQMIDIRQPMKVLGPVEEFQEIDLTEFRRLGPTPAAAINKIVEKIGLLQEESWQMRMDGVAAWQRSATNQVYVAQGRESIESGKRLEEVINSRQQAGQPYLSVNEWLAVNALNSHLIA
jgi:2'-5' RNA ligase